MLGCLEGWMLGGSENGLVLVGAPFRVRLERVCERKSLR